MEECPVDHKSLLRGAWENHGEAQTQLRAITEEGADILVGALTQEALEQKAYLVQRAAAHQISPKLPYGEVEQQLPPDIFGPLETTDTYRLPGNMVTRAIASYRYRKTYQEKVNAQDNEEYRYAARSETYKQMYKKLRSLSRDHAEVDQEKWAMLQEAAELQKLQGQYYLELAQSFRQGSTNFLYAGEIGESIRNIAVGRHEYYKTAHLNASREYFTPADFITLPVGEYGPELTEKLIRTTVLATQAAQIVLPDWSKHVTKEHPETTMHMLRVRDGYEDAKEVGAMQNIQEGVNSIAQTLALLTAEKIPGYEDGVELVQAIIDERIVEQFTRVSLMGFIAPITNEGLFIPGLLQIGANGRLELNPEAMSAMKELKRQQAVGLAQEWIAHQAIENPDPKSVPAALGLVCPAAMPNGAISRILAPVAQIMKHPELHKKELPVLIDNSWWVY